MRRGVNILFWRWNSLKLVGQGSVDRPWDIIDLFVIKFPATDSMIIVLNLLSVLFGSGSILILPQ